MAYSLGTLVQLSTTFTNTSGIAADPTAVTLYVAAPGAPKGTSTQYTGAQLTRVGTGVYTYSLYLNKPGTWTYCWEGTGALEAATFDIPLVVSKSNLRTS